MLRAKKKLLLLTICSVCSAYGLVSSAPTLAQAEQVTIQRYYVTLSELKVLCRDTVYPIGCAVPLGKNCTIYLPKKEEFAKIRAQHDKFSKAQDILLELFILGHETKHCFDGHWHD